MTLIQEEVMLIVKLIKNLNIKWTIGVSLWYWMYNRYDDEIQSGPGTSVKQILFPKLYDRIERRQALF